MSTHAGNQSTSSKRIEELLKRLQTWVLALLGAFRNRVFASATTGTVVAAGATIAQVLNFKTTTAGRIEVKAWATGSFTTGAGRHVTPVISFGPHGGALAVVVQGSANVDGETDFSCDTILSVTPGVGYDVVFSTTAGDVSLTLGTIAGTALSAGLIVQEGAV